MRQILIALSVLVVSMPAFADALSDMTSQDLASMNKWDVQKKASLSGPQKIIYCDYRGGGLTIKTDDVAKTVRSEGGTEAKILTYSDAAIEGLFGPIHFTLTRKINAGVEGMQQMDMNDAGKVSTAICWQIIPKKIF